MKNDEMTMYSLDENSTEYMPKAALAAAMQGAEASSAAMAAPPTSNDIAGEDEAPSSGSFPAELLQGADKMDAQALRLGKQLQHYRSWVASVHLRVQHMNPKAIQNAKRLYVGNLPQNVTEEELCAFMNELMLQTRAQVGPEPAVLQCHLTPDRNFAFAEFRSVEEASNAMGLDGVAWRDAFLKIRRPSNYDLATSLMLGPITPDPTMDVSCLNLSKPAPEESPNKLFVGGLPCEWPEQAVRLILEPWGAIKAFNLVMDKATGNSKGYAFCEFVDDTVTDGAIAGLNGQRAGTKTLTVKRAAEGARQAMVAASSGMAQGSSSGMSPQPSQPSSYDDPSSARAGGGGGGGSHLSTTFPVAGMLGARKSTGSGQAMSGSGGPSSSAAYMMSPQAMGMMMPGMAQQPRSQGYGALGMQRPMVTSHDSHMGHMPSMQQMVQPFPGQAYPGQAHAMHYNPGGINTMMMAGPQGMMMSPNHTSFHSSLDPHVTGLGMGSGMGSSRATAGKPQSTLMRGVGAAGSGNLSSNFGGSGTGSGSWTQQVMQVQASMMPALRQSSANQMMQGSKGHE